RHMARSFPVAYCRIRCQKGPHFSVCIRRTASLSACSGWIRSGTKWPQSRYLQHEGETMNIVHLFYPVDAGMKDIPDTGQVLAIGDFDGVHLGHRSVLAEAARIAAAKRLPLAVMTFNPHPREVL